MRAAWIALACASGLLAACGGSDSGFSQPRPATAAAAVADASPPLTVPVAHGSQPDIVEQEPMDVGALRLPQPEDAEPEPVR